MPQGPGQPQGTPVPALGEFIREWRRLRWVSVGAQGLTLLVALSYLGMALPVAPLLAGVLLLAAANLVLQRWDRAPAPGLRAVLIELGFDLGLLTWQLYWAGGPSNPFVSLFLAPIALAATALPSRAVCATGAMAALGYALLWLDHHSLPHTAREFDLHVLGMWVNFMLTAGVVAGFGSRSAGVLWAQRLALAQARERALRDEGLMAVASLAAGAAHAINTPLSTMSVVLADLRAGCAESDPALGKDLELLQQQVMACREAVRSLVSEAEPADDAAPQLLPVRLESALQRWRLLRPAFELAVTLSPSVLALSLPVERSFDYLLWNLLNNAADASLAAGSRQIGLAVAREGDHLLLTVSDHGRGLPALPLPFRSAKPQGMGLGLALARQICERWGGELQVGRSENGGEIHARLSLAALRAAA